MSTNFSLTYTIPDDVLRAAEERMATAFARYGGDPDAVSFARAAAYIEVAKLGDSIRKMALPCRVQPLSFTPGEPVKVITIFESQADMRLFEAQQADFTTSGGRA